LATRNICKAFGENIVNNRITQT